MSVSSTPQSGPRSHVVADLVSETRFVSPSTQRRHVQQTSTPLLAGFPGNDDELERRQRRRSRVAAGTLDASAKIYAVRVDAVHADTYRVLGGLGKDSKPGPEGEQEAQEEEGGESEGAKKPKRKKSSNKKTVEQNLNNINSSESERKCEVRAARKPGGSWESPSITSSASHVSLCPPTRVPSAARFFSHCKLTVQPPQSYSVGGQRSSGQLAGRRLARPQGAQVDPMFQKMASSFDESSTAGVFLPVLRSFDCYSELLFHSDVAPLRSGPARELPPVSRVSVARLRASLQQAQEKASICPSLEDFSFTQWTSESYNQNVSEMLEKHKRGDHVFDVHAEPESEPWGCGPEGDEDFDADACEEGKEGDVSRDEERREGCTARERNRDVIPIGEGDIGTMCLQLSSKPGEYSYFSPRTMSMWAGPGHWRFKPRHKHHLLAPGQLSKLSKKRLSGEHEDGIGEYDYNNPNDTSNFCPGVQVNKIELNYAKTAKKMDMRRLKRSMWCLLTDREDKAVEVRHEIRVQTTNPLFGSGAIPSHHAYQSLLKELLTGLPSAASSKGAPCGVQDVPYSLDVVGSSPGYSTADRGWELTGGRSQLAECRPGGGRVRSARMSSAHRAPAPPVVWPGACGLACKLPRAALSSDAVALRWLHSECEKKRTADGTRFGGQRVFIFTLPSQFHRQYNLNKCIFF
ncbi:UNVERIFIED_CONTAM: hypothetical protein FKN15_077503 [Acipenser sinensis]